MLKTIRIITIIILNQSSFSYLLSMMSFVAACTLADSAIWLISLARWRSMPKLSKSVGGGDVNMMIWWNYYSMYSTIYSSTHLSINSPTSAFTASLSLSTVPKRLVSNLLASVADEARYEYIVYSRQYIGWLIDWWVDG